MRFAHHMIHVRNLDRAVAFYTNVLGCHVADRHVYDGAELVYLSGLAPGVELELIMPDQWPFAEAPETGRGHIAFTVTGLDAEHARLSELGVGPGAIEDYTANGAIQTRYFYFSDPEGNQIEFLEPRGRYATAEDLT
jgi:lactoylglutathione lyase